MIQEDDGIFRLTTFQYSAKEGSANVPIVVQRTGAAGGPASVELVAEESGSATGGVTCAPGVDFVASTQIVNFAPSQTSKTVTVTVPLCGDTLAEGGETFTVRLQDPQGGPVLGAPHQATVSLVNDDVAGTVQFAATAQTVGEDQTEAVITLTRTGGAAGGVEVRVTTHDGSAHAGTDYDAVDTVVTFGVGDVTQTVTVPIIPNGSADGARFMTLELDMPQPEGQTKLGALSTIPLWIVDDDD